MIKTPARAERGRKIPVAMLKPPGVQTGKRMQSALVERAVGNVLHLTIAAVPESKHPYGA
jgi:hypothetical protein